MVFGGVRVLVRTEHLEQARAVLAQRDRGELEAALTEELHLDVLRCRRCQCERLVERRNWFVISLALMLLWLCRAIFPPAKDLRCESCGELN